MAQLIAFFIHDYGLIFNSGGTNKKPVSVRKRMPD